MAQVVYVAGGELRGSVAEGVRGRHIVPVVFRLPENLETLFCLLEILGQGVSSPGIVTSPFGNK